MTQATTHERFGREELDQSLPDRFEKQVCQFPHHIAVKDDRNAFTYQALNEAANQLAHAILARRGPAVETIAFLIEHSALQSVAILGILKAGKIYVPIDPAFPENRITQMLEDSQATTLITNQENLALAHSLAQDRLLVLNLESLPADLPTTNPALSIDPDTYALIHYTSGSTGRPKGAIQSHRTVLHFIMLVANSWPIGPEDHIAHFVSCSFSAAVLTTFGALLNGAGLYPYDLKRQGLPQLPRWLQAEQITIYFAVPSAFRHFVSTLQASDTFPDVRLLILAGETVLKSDFELYQRYMADTCYMRNILAGTEMYLIRSFLMDKQTPINESPIPVGYEVEDKELLLLDENGRPVPPGQEGEIVVRSRYLSPGYWQRPDLTQAAFAPDPEGGDKRLYYTGDMGWLKPDGCLVHIGRKDSMVKIRGQRVEIGDIEAALLSLPTIRNAVVIPWRDSQDQTQLVAYLVPREQPGPTVSALRAALREALPDFMVPTLFNMLDELPQTATGKVNRRALPEPDWTRPQIGSEYTAPQDKLEAELVAICEKALAVSPIGVQDNLFDLGLDSLHYLTLFTTIEKQFGRKLALQSLPQPTVQALAALLRPDQEAAVPQPVRPPAAKPGKLARPQTFLEKWVAPLSYPLGSQLIARLTSSRLIQNRYFPAEAELIRRFIPFAQSQLAPDAIIHQSLAANQCLPWRFHRLGQMAADPFSRHITVRGWERLEAAHRQGRGVLVLNNHAVLGHLVMLPLVRAGLAEVGFIGTGLRRLHWLGLNASDQLQLLVTRDEDKHSLATNLYLAKQILERGGLVQLAGDGYQGSGGLTLPFHGRLRPFRRGFAELALATGSVILPVFVNLALDGRVEIAFQEPLTTTGTAGDHIAQGDALIHNYVALLDRWWRESPGNISWLHMREFLALPPA
jgi:amino acid adenylation domain-containing protein